MRTFTPSQGWLISLFIFCSLALSARAQHRLDHWTADNGLPQNSVSDLRQTRDGFLWIATNDGLVRFDGVRFTVFDKSNTTGLNSNRITALYEDPSGILWAGTENGLARYNGKNFITYSTDHGLPDPEVRGVSGDESGVIWVVSGEKVMRLDKDHFSPADTQGIHSPFSVSHWNKENFFSWDAKGIYRFARGRVTRYPPWPALQSKSLINRIEESPTEGLWIATGIGIYFSRNGTAAPNEFSRVLEPENNIYARDVRFIDQNGGEWAMELNKGLYPALVFKSSDRKHRILNVTATFADREGSLWVGTQGEGLYRIRKQGVRVYTKAEGLIQDNIYPIFQDRSGAIWIGAWESGISRIKDGQVTNYTTKEGLLSGYPVAIFEDRSGRIWISTHGYHNGGLQVLDPSAPATASSRPIRRVEERILPDGALTMAIYQETNVHQSEAGFWFGTSKGLAEYRNGVTRMYTTKDGLAGNEVRAILKSAAGPLWIACLGGISKYENGRFTSFTESDGLPSNSVRALYEDREGVLWIGTYDGGLGRYVDGQFTRYTTREGLFNNGVFQILEDEAGHFWMSSNRGIYRVSRQELNEFAAGRRQVINSIPYGKKDGLLNIECNGGSQPAGIRARDGKLWFPTQEGVAVLDPAVLRSGPQPPEVLIERVRVGRDPSPFHDQVLTIEAGQENFEIEYTTTSLLNSEYVRFKYRLEGLNHDWIEAGTRRTAYYSNVPPGEYTFKVIAANSEGVWNAAGQSLRIHVLPPFYKTWWFRSLLVLMAGGAVLGAFRYRLHQVRRIQLAQQDFARQLIESQESERRRIASELHDSLGQQLIVIKSRAMMGGQASVLSSMAQEQFDEIVASSSRMIAEVRAISHNLCPASLELLGLNPVIMEMIEGISNSSGLQISADIEPLNGLLSKDGEINLYRILQEGLNNILKHSRATKAYLEIWRDGGTLRIILRDNGIGCDPERLSHPHGGMGLFSIRERVMLLSGEHSLKTAPGEGMMIEVKIPLSPGAGAVRRWNDSNLPPVSLEQHRHG